MTLVCPLVHFEMLLYMAILCVLLSQPGQQTTANITEPSQPSPFLKLISSKHQTTTKKVKLSNQNPVSTAKLSQDSTSSNQSLLVPAKPSLPLSHRVSGDGSSSPSQPTIKVVISDTCVQRNVQGHKTNQTSNQGQEITLQQGSPLVLTQKINLVQDSCPESCGAQFTALQVRLEKLEKEVSILRKKYNGADGICCPSQLREEGECLNDCSDQGRCEKGKCICFQGFSGPDCSSVTCPSNCHERGVCVDGQCVCESSFTGPDCFIKSCPNDCSNRGRCVQGTCQCDTGFSGIDCADKACPGNCNNRGQCLKGKCLCHPGFTGLDCSNCEAGFTGAQCVSVFPGIDKRPVIKVNVETVTMKVAPGTDKNNRKTSEKTKLNKAILSKMEEEKLKAQRKMWKEKVSGEKDDSNKTRADSSLKQSTEKSGSKKLVFISSTAKSHTNTGSEVKSDSVQPDKSRDSDLKTNTGTEKTATNTTSVKKPGTAKSPTKENKGAGSMSGHKMITIKSLHIANSTRIFQGQKKLKEVFPKQPEGRRQEGATKLDSKLDMKQDDKVHFQFGVKVDGKQDPANTTLAKADKPIYQNETKSFDSSKEIKKASKEKIVTEPTFGMTEARKESTEQIILYSKSETKITEKKPIKRYQIIHGTVRENRTDSKDSEFQRNITTIKYKSGSGVRSTDVIHSNGTVVQPREPQRNITVLKDGQTFGTIDKPVKLQRNITVRDGSQSGFSGTGIVQDNRTTDKSTAPQRNITVSKVGQKSAFSRKELIHANGTTEKPTKSQRNNTILVRGFGFKKSIAIQVNETTDKASEVRRNITVFKGNQDPKYRRTGLIHTNGTADMPKESQRNITVHKDSQKSIVKESGVVHVNRTSEEAKEVRRNVTVHRKSQGSLIKGTELIPKNETSEKPKEARRNISVFTESQRFSLRQTSIILTNGTAGKLKEPVRNITVHPDRRGSTLKSVELIHTNRTDSSTLVGRNKTSNMKTGSIKADVSTRNQTLIDKTHSQGNNTSLSRGEVVVKLKGERSINRTVLLKTASEKKSSSAGQISKVLHHRHTGQFHDGTQQRGPQRPSEDLQHRHDPLKSKGRPMEAVREKNDTRAGGSHVVTDRNSTSRARQLSQEVRSNITTAQLDLVPKMSLHSAVKRKNSSSTPTSDNVTSSHPVDSTKVRILSEHQAGPSIQTNSSITSAKRTLLSLGSVRVENITSRGFILTWEAPRGMFKNFTVTTRENGAESAQEMEEEEAENEEDGKYEEDDDDMKIKSEDVFSQTNVNKGGNEKHSARRSEDAVNRGNYSNTTAYTSAKPHSRAATRRTGSNIRKLSVVPGSTRLLTVRNLRPQTRYSLSLYGTSPGVRSKIHHLTVTTAPEPPTELLFSNVTDSSLSVSWTKPRNPVTGYKVTYTNTESGKPVSLEVDPQHSSVALSQLLPASSYDVSVTAQHGLDHSDPITGLVVTVPDPPTALKAVDVTDTRAVLRWVPALAAVDRYIIVYGSKSGAKVTTAVSGDVPELQLKDLQSATAYTVTMTSQRDSLQSATVNLTFITTGGKQFLKPMDCSQQLLNGMLHSGVAQIFPGSKQDEGVRVYCDMETDGGGWTVFQRRMNGKTNFFRNWEQYSKGFGNLSGEFWLGNELIHSLTSSRPMVLRVDLRAGAETAFAMYSSFYIGPQRKHYAVRLSGYSGTAGDSMKYHNGQPFSTRDRDPNPVLSGCARSYRGGWWYKDCHEANLNGLYDINTNHQGVIWTAWKGRDFSIPFTELKLRPVNFDPQTQG